MPRIEFGIGRGSRGYVASYRFEKESDLVFVLAVRRQRGGLWPLRCSISTGP